MLRVFDASKDAALLLQTEQGPRAAREQLQQRHVRCIESALCHDMPSEFLDRHRPRRIPQGVKGRSRHVPSDSTVSGARDLLSDAFES
jgi:hypothetical protein